jgi:glycerophosphoryl diester phosphodiesterase
MVRIALCILLTLSEYSFAFDWQGHRGARGLYPENTIGAMEEALKFPITTLELDVVISKNSKVIVSHEPWMHEDICLDPEGKRIKGRKYNIFKMTYEDITKFDCGSLPHPRFPGQKKINTGKPTLEKLIKVNEETLKKLNRNDVVYNVEIKSLPEYERDGFQPNYKDFSDLVTKALLELLPASKFTIQSFDWRVLQHINKTHPDLKLSALKEGSISPVEDLKKLGFKPYAFSPYFKFLTKDHVDYFHKLEIKVIPWTVNELADMEQLISLKVDGIITDFPNLIGEVGMKKCKDGYNLFEGSCVEIPAHALPSHQNPGWVCKAGHIQKRSHCIKITIPKHGHLLPDGKTWECDKGYVRYRSTCKKR